MGTISHKAMHPVSVDLIRSSMIRSLGLEWKFFVIDTFYDMHNHMLRSAGDAPRFDFQIGNHYHLTA